MHLSKAGTIREKQREDLKQEMNHNMAQKSTI